MQPEPRCLGLIEDDPIMGESLARSLTLEGYRVGWWQSGAAALRAIAEGPAPDALICDIRLPDMSGEALFAALGRDPGRVPVLFVTAFADVDQAVRLMRAGAADYVTKPFAMADFLDRLTALLPAAAAGAGVLGVSDAMRGIEAYLARIAGRSGPVPFTGETGTGKEVCARHLHALDGARGPFMAVNCAAIPADLLESEIFGHERGAFTGAAARHPGYAERAGAGTLFLDEIAEMPVALQAKLLRLIEERGFHRLGGARAVAFRARILAATNREAEAAVAAGALRADLLYRLNLFTVEIPPLRDRPEDVDWLIRRLIAAAGPGAPEPAAAALEAARAHGWPGNARELSNRVERALALAEGPRIGPGDLFPERAGPRTAPPPALALAHVRDAAERRAIEGALSETGGRVREAAALLGVGRTTLWEKMKRLGLGA